MKRYRASHMIRMEHLNHHGNLYAGQAIEWMVEMSFITVNCEYGNPQGLLYKNTHKFDFYKSVNPGNIVYYEGVIVRAGRTSLTVRVGMYNEVTGDLMAEGFTTFVTVNPENNRPVAHGIVPDAPADDDEKGWRREAEGFFAKKVSTE
ncbi:MAG: hotdog domain-containing protein [Firmicutes bacterium]|nr:hotdog domain-containing protein [Bacillota bacterium]